LPLATFRHRPPIIARLPASPAVWLGLTDHYGPITITDKNVTVHGYCVFLWGQYRDIQANGQALLRAVLSLFPTPDGWLGVGMSLRTGCRGVLPAMTGCIRPSTGSWWPRHFTASLLVLMLLAGCDPTGPVPTSGVIVFARADYRSPYRIFVDDVMDLRLVDEEPDAGDCADKLGQERWTDCISSIRVADGWQAVERRASPSRSTCRTSAGSQYHHHHRQVLL